MSYPEELNPVYQNLPESEIRRIADFEYPNKKSAELLPLDLRGQKVGDIGAGSGTQLKELITGRGGSYTAVDAKAEMLLEQKTSEADSLAQGNILHLPFKDRSFDILHTRFVIMNLKKIQRPLALKELARVGKINYVLDYDWSTFNPVNKITEKLIKNFREVALFVGTDLEHGKKLKKLVAETLNIDESTVKETIFNEGPVTEYKELKNLAKTIGDVCGKIGLIDKAKEFYEIEEIIKKNKSPELLVPFVRPNIVGVEF